MTVVPGIRASGAIKIEAVVQVKKINKGEVVLTYQSGDELIDVSLLEGWTMTLSYDLPFSNKGPTLKEALKAIKRELDE
jgi:hypothetical protein